MLWATKQDGGKHERKKLLVSGNDAAADVGAAMEVMVMVPAVLVVAAIKIMVLLVRLGSDDNGSFCCVRCT